MLRPDAAIPRAWTRYSFNARLVAVGIVALAAFVAVLSVPGRASEPELFTQWLFNYGCGLVKRALVGDILTRVVLRPGHPISATAMHAVVVAISVVTALLFALYSARVWIAGGPAPRPQRIQVLLATALLSMSPIGAMYYAGARQYPEVSNLLVLALFANVLLARPPHRALLACGALASLISTLIHESSLLSTSPVMLALAVMDTPEGPARQRATAVSVGTLALSTVAVLYIGAVSPAIAACVTDQLASRVGFPLDPEKVAVLTTTFSGNILMTLRAYAEADNGLRIPLSLVLAAPAMLFLCLSLMRREPGRMGWALAAVGLLPFGLIILADDVYRWFVLSVVGLCVLLLASAWHHDHDAEDDWLTMLGLAALLIALVVPYPFFRGASANPLFDRLLAVVRLI